MKMHEGKIRQSGKVKLLQDHVLHAGLIVQSC